MGTQHPCRSLVVSRGPCSPRCSSPVASTRCRHPDQKVSRAAPVTDKIAETVPLPGDTATLGRVNGAVWSPRGAARTVGCPAWRGRARCVVDPAPRPPLLGRVDAGASSAWPPTRQALRPRPRSVSRCRPIIGGALMLRHGHPPGERSRRVTRPMASAAGTSAATRSHFEPERTSAARCVAGRQLGGRDHRGGAALRCGQRPLRAHSAALGITSSYARAQPASPRRTGGFDRECVRRDAARAAGHRGVRTVEFVANSTR